MEGHVSDLAEVITTLGRILGISREPTGAEKKTDLKSQKEWE